MLILKSPAKINLFLRILRRRPDGYHEIASLFQAVDLCDTLHLATAQADHFTCTDPSLAVDATNLVVKAIHLFRAQTRITTPLSIHLEKLIPQQAGLGGGSSNAATTLWGLNELCGRPASTAQLAAWGAAIGSDVSFFLSGGTAYCTGRGECVQNLEPLNPLELTIVKPAEGLSTPLVYGKVKADLLPHRNPEQVLEQFKNGIFDYFNDLEEAAFGVMGSLAELKSRLLQSGFSAVLMSGSGSSFFCTGEGKVPSDLKHYRVRTLNRPSEEWYKLKAKR